MVNVQLYQPGNIDFSFSFPEEWNEFTAPQLQVIARYVFSEIKNVFETKAALLMEMLSMEKKIPATALEKIPSEQLSAYGLQLIDFLWKENTLSRQPYPSLTVKGKYGISKKMIGPADHFDNLLCGEYEQADIYFTQFLQENKTEHLAALAAVLYRPAGTPLYKFNYRMNEYKQYNFEKNIPLFLRLPQEVLLTIFLWYTGCRYLLTLTFPNVYSKGKGDGQPDPMAFTKCIHSAAGEKNGSREKIRVTLMKEILMEMELQIIHANELEAHYANQSK